MRTIRRLTAVTLAAALISLGLPVATAAASNQARVDIWDHSSYEYTKYCQDAPPYECNLETGGGLLRFVFNVINRPMKNKPIDIGWELVDVTTTAGADYTGPTSGTLTIPANRVQGTLLFPVVKDGVGAPDLPVETFEVHMTSINVSADISDVGIGTIQDGAQIPEDCSLARIDTYEKSLTCTERPAGQQWHLNVFCLAFGLVDIAVGNTVTGNGTSNARCTQGGYAGNTFFILES